jgi:hypothetical protein
VEAEEDGSFSADVVTYSGKTGAPLWSDSVGLPGAPYAQGVEVDGDGKGDVLLTAIDWGGFGGESETQMVTLFSSDLFSTRARFLGMNGLAFPEPVPNVIGKGTQDLLVLRENEDWSMRAMLFDGDWDADFPADIGWWRSGEYIELAGDATGDGAEDILVYDFTYDEALDEYVETTELVSGSNGQTAWTHVVGESDPYSFIVGTGADGNASGTADLARIVWLDNGDEYSLVEGSDGSSLWAKARRVGGYLYYLHAGLLEGTGDDLLESVEGDAGFKTAARRGEDGAVIWKR